MTKRCIELLRVSTSGQADADKASLPTQRAVNRQTAAAYGLTIVKTIELSDVSGAQVLLAPEIQEMFVLMAHPEIHGVIVREFSRLMRPENFADYAMLQAFVDSETLLYLPDGPIDFASDTGMLTGTMRAVMGGMERRELVKKMWRIKEQKRREGGFSQSKICLPFGVGYRGEWYYTADAQRVAESFRLVLAGNVSYAGVGSKVGIEPYNLRNILRNPIYTGYRVIDKRRDPSPKAKKAGKDGRQGDRPKIQRAPEDVIRVKVMEPLVSESDFSQVQRILAHKRVTFQRMHAGPHRFTYNGFLLCGECQSLLYTKYRRDDYYVCKVRCGAPYQRRDVLEPKLDKLFTTYLTRPTFLKKMVKMMKRPQQDNSERLIAQLKSLDAKSQRILDAYFEEVINARERDRRQSDVLRERKIVADLLERERPRPTATLETLVAAFSPFAEFDLLNREDKRQLLNTLTPSILASKYRIAGLWIASERVPEVNRTDMAYFRNEGLQGRIWLELPKAA